MRFHTFFQTYILLLLLLLFCFSHSNANISIKYIFSYGMKINGKCKNNKKGEIKIIGSFMCVCAVKVLKIQSFCLVFKRKRINLNRLIFFLLHFSLCALRLKQTIRRCFVSQRRLDGDLFPSLIFSWPKCN